ncbi:MAG: hypothetical protein RIC87_11070 [Kiloniellales bacterium]
MKYAAITVLALSLTPLAALADEPVNDDEANAIQNALNAWGCAGGDMEKESGDVLHYEVEDAECDAGEYDFRLDKDFNVLLISRH